jgi:3-oxoacyl-[acyl-carrier-protein] synthase I
MSLQALTVYGTGLVCGVGLNSAAACAAIRAGINNFQETRFMDNGGEWIMGCEVPLEQPWRGRKKLVKMAAMAIGECMANSELKIVPSETPLLLCIAEAERPGRLAGLNDELFLEIQTELGMNFHEQSSLIPQGRVSGAVALHQARKLIYEKGFRQILIVGIDGFLNPSTLMGYQEQERLLTSQNSNGFIPGEAASAIIVGAPIGDDKTRLHCLGMGFAIEQATVESELPLRSDGLSTAIKSTEMDAGCTIGSTDFRITDLSGEQYYFKEAALALSRTLRERKEFYDIWHPADCFGEIGASIGPAILIALLDALKKGYAPGTRILKHLGNDNGKRSALIFSYQAARN